MAKVELRTRLMRSYVFCVVVETNEDRWSAYAPLLKHQGAATWRCTGRETLKHIVEVVLVTMASMAMYGESIPEELRTGSRAASEP